MAYDYEKTVSEIRQRRQNTAKPPKRGRSAKEEYEHAREALLAAAEHPRAWPRSHRVAVVQRFLIAHRAVNQGRDITKGEAAAIGVLAPELDPIMIKANSRPRAVREAEARRMEAEMAAACSTQARPAKRTSATTTKRTAPNKAQLDRERAQQQERERRELRAKRARIAARPAAPVRRREGEPVLVGSARSVTRVAETRRIA